MDQVWKEVPKQTQYKCKIKQWDFGTVYLFYNLNPAIQYKLICCIFKDEV